MIVAAEREAARVASLKRYLIASLPSGIQIFLDMWFPRTCGATESVMVQLYVVSARQKDRAARLQSFWAP